jgi:hypothetical protein
MNPALVAVTAALLLAADIVLPIVSKELCFLHFANV